MFPFRQIEPNRAGVLWRMDIPLNEWLGLKFEQGQESAFANVAGRWFEDKFAAGDLVPADKLNEEFGIPKVLTFTEPMPWSRAYLMRQRAEGRLAQQAFLDMAQGGAFRSIAGFGAMLAGTTATPFDLALNFVPFVGVGARAASLARAGAGAFRVALARGLLTTEESLARFSFAARFPRFTAHTIDATIGNAIVEIPTFIQNRRDQVPYGIEDSAINVIGGGLAGGAIATGLAHAARLMSRLGTSTRELMFRKAVEDGVTTGDIRVDPLARMDESVIERVVVDRLSAEDAPAVRTEPEPVAGPELVTVDRLLELARGARETVLALAQTAGAPAPQSAILARLIARFDAGERSPDLFRNLESLLGVEYDPVSVVKRLKRDLNETINAITKTEPLLESASPSIRETVSANIRTLEERRNRLADAIEAHMADLETRRKSRATRLEIEAERQKRVVEYATRRTAELAVMPSIKSEMASTREPLPATAPAAEVGHGLSKEDIRRLTVTDPKTGLDMINEDIKTLEADLKASAGDKPDGGGLTEDERRLLDEVESLKPEPAVIEAAARCLTDNIHGQ